jgi:hypothetical protein
VTYLLTLGLFIRACWSLETSESELVPLDINRTPTEFCQIFEEHLLNLLTGEQGVFQFSPGVFPDPRRALWSSEAFINDLAIDASYSQLQFPELVAINPDNSAFAEALAWGERGVAPWKVDKAKRDHEAEIQRLVSKFFQPEGKDEKAAQRPKSPTKPPEPQRRNLSLHQTREEKASGSGGRSLSLQPEVRAAQKARPSQRPTPSSAELQADFQPAAEAEDDFFYDRTDEQDEREKKR